MHDRDFDQDPQLLLGLRKLGGRNRCPSRPGRSAAPGTPARVSECVSPSHPADLLTMLPSAHPHYHYRVRLGYGAASIGSVFLPACTVDVLAGADDRRNRRVHVQMEVAVASSIWGVTSSATPWQRKRLHRMVGVMTRQKTVLAV